MTSETFFKIIIIFSCFLFSCSNRTDTLDEFEKLERPNCGEIVRRWGQNTSFEEGNPCGDGGPGGGGGDFTIQVSNQLTGNIKNFCVNITVYVRSENVLGGTWCDNEDPSGW